jgi:NAD+ synthase (glutamine-hydrolysing)
MKRKMRVAIAQIDCTVGDLDGNRRKIEDWLKRSRSAGADIVSFPELAVTGYPPEDLLLKPKFISDNLDSLKAIARSVGDMVAVVGFVDRTNEGLFNAAAVINKGDIRGIYHKAMLPNYGVFDEDRYFRAGTGSGVYTFGGAAFGVNICEDIWRGSGPLERQVDEGSWLILNISASPYYMGKTERRRELIGREASAKGVFISYTNLVGGQDELVFDGQSMVVDPSGKALCTSPAFSEDLLLCDVDMPSDRPVSIKAVDIAGELPAGQKPPIKARAAVKLDEVAEVYAALGMGVRDYALKNGFAKAVIGLSGGIDSSLVAAIASDCLGRENVTGVFMPTRYSSDESEADARALAASLGIRFSVIPIEPIYKLYLLSLEQQFAGTKPGISEENLQARIRGNILMALSNKFGCLVLTTGNKSEMSTGYATLYGDMAGGLAVIKDVPKTLVYRLAKHRNSTGPVIPERVLTKEPTAELRAGQKDSDSLPPYGTLDPIIRHYVEEDRSADEIVSSGFDKETVAKVIGLIDRSEYKRRQSPPGIKITPKAFGRDRRMPITSGYKG